MNAMLIKVKVFPDSKKQEIIKKGDDSFDIKVKEKAERGEATKAVKKIISSYFKTDRVRLIKGAKQRNKIFKLN